jgi:transcriptional regulator with XRE-family HTH domain
MPRHDTEVLSRRAEVARRYLQGEMQEQIAQSFGVTQGQISQDLKAIRAAWLASAVRDFDALKAQELAKIDAVEREYWLAWERSKKDKEISVQEGGEVDPQTRKPRIKKVVMRRESQAGNPAFLAGVLTCIERRCSILGLDAPKRFVIRWDDLTDEQIDRLAAGEPPEKVLSA